MGMKREDEARKKEKNEANKLSQVGSVSRDPNLLDSRETEDAGNDNGGQEFIRAWYERDDYLLRFIPQVFGRWDKTGKKWCGLKTCLQMFWVNFMILFWVVSSFAILYYLKPLLLG